MHLPAQGRFHNVPLFIQATRGEHLTVLSGICVDREVGVYFGDRIWNLCYYHGVMREKVSFLDPVLVLN